MRISILLTAILTVGVQCFPALAADTDVTTHPRYLLRAGDILHLQYRMTPDYDQTVLVQPDGYINVKIAGEVYVAGLSVTQVHDLILTKETEVLKDPELDIVLEEFTRPYVVVAGEVAKPGPLEIRDSISALSAIMLAGGFTDAARSGHVLVYRKKNDQIAEVTRLNLTRMGKTFQLKKDMALQSGDIVVVPHDRLSRIRRYVQAANVGFYTDISNLAK